MIVYYDNELKRVQRTASFHSFRRALALLRQTKPQLAARAQLVSMHSTSKGFYGECGLRGGFFALVASQVNRQTTLSTADSGNGLQGSAMGGKGHGLKAANPRLAGA